jgi:3-hydroxymyristoyl/3-hydroxydecanoyl-(acyl carrier protein) dehydratase
MHSVDLHIAAEHPAFGGHFPGQPLLPGVSLLAEVLEALLDNPALAAIIGPEPRIGAAKFLAPVRPGARLTIRLEPGARGVRFEIKDGERVAASGQFDAVRGPDAGPPPAGPQVRGRLTDAPVGRAAP